MHTPHFRMLSHRPAGGVGCVCPSGWRRLELAALERHLCGRAAVPCVPGCPCPDPVGPRAAFCSHNARRRPY